MNVKADMDVENNQKTTNEQPVQNSEEHNDKLQKTFSQINEESCDQYINDNFQLDEILSEFLSTLMARNYKSALHYCKLILLYEPNNEIVQDFYPLIEEKMHLDNYGSDECDESESSATKSESLSEYFSSTSVGTENLSSSSFTSEEDDESVN
ncbi:glutamate-rich protein 2-like isoform X1 [Argiope bruennichi]|uniref:Glutamate-rich protein 2 like protein n=1 Tax=Argiope bruennichi TaxID=94029 RepID=A0A8T0E500_ARGBR|nr:glutamate-rich protein 2-like isoform X1 [Argiope bruennichi]KAF8766398.1 Glutamate-rich protein 2 like protein [Argiope bruennichi]